jgi:Flp pilus assembly protein TadD
MPPWDNGNRFREGPTDPLRALKLAEQAVAAQPEEWADLSTLGLALHRAGRSADAIRKLDESIRLQESGGRVYDLLFLSLAHQKVGHAEEARKWLTKAQHWLDQMQADQTEAAKYPWYRRLTWQILRAEAESLIGKAP